MISILVATTSSAKYCFSVNDFSKCPQGYTHINETNYHLWASLEDVTPSEVEIFYAETPHTDKDLYLNISDVPEGITQVTFTSDLQSIVYIDTVNHDIPFKTALFKNIKIGVEGLILSGNNLYFSNSELIGNHKINCNILRIDSIGLQNVISITSSQTSIDAKNINYNGTILFPNHKMQRVSLTSIDENLNITIIDTLMKLNGLNFQFSNVNAKCSFAFTNGQKELRVVNAVSVGDSLFEGLHIKTAEGLKIIVPISTGTFSKKPVIDADNGLDLTIGGSVCDFLITNTFTMSPKIKITASNAVQIPNVIVTDTILELNSGANPELSFTLPRVEGEEGHITLNGGKVTAAEMIVSKSPVRFEGSAAVETTGIVLHADAQFSKLTTERVSFYLGSESIPKLTATLKSDPTIFIFLERNFNSIKFINKFADQSIQLIQGPTDISEVVFGDKPVKSFEIGLARFEVTKDQNGLYLKISKIEVRTDVICISSNEYLCGTYETAVSTQSSFTNALQKVPENGLALKIRIIDNLELSLSSTVRIPVEVYGESPNARMKISSKGAESIPSISFNSVTISNEDQISKIGSVVITKSTVSQSIIQAASSVSIDLESAFNIQETISLNSLNLHINGNTELTLDEDLKTLSVKNDDRKQSFTTQNSLNVTADSATNLQITGEGAWKLNVDGEGYIIIKLNGFNKNDLSIGLSDGLFSDVEIVSDARANIKKHSNIFSKNKIIVNNGKLNLDFQLDSGSILDVYPQSNQSVISALTVGNAEINYNVSDPSIDSLFVAKNGHLKLSRGYDIKKIEVGKHSVFQMGNYWRNSSIEMSTYGDDYHFPSIKFISQANLNLHYNDNSSYVPIEYIGENQKFEIAGKSLREAKGSVSGRSNIKIIFEKGSLFVQKSDEIPPSPTDSNARSGDIIIAVTNASISFVALIVLCVSIYICTKKSKAVHNDTPLVTNEVE